MLPLSPAEWSWVGVGLSEGGMYGADIALASHDDARSLWLAGDYFAAANGFPQLDVQQVGGRARGFPVVWGLPAREQHWRKNWVVG